MGCHFHQAQSYYRRIQKAGLTPLYITEPSFAQCAQCYVALPYLPRADREEALALLLDWEFDPKMNAKDMEKASEWNLSTHQYTRDFWLKGQLQMPCYFGHARGNTNNR